MIRVMCAAMTLDGASAMSMHREWGARPICESFHLCPIDLSSSLVSLVSRPAFM